MMEKTFYNLIEFEIHMQSLLIIALNNTIDKLLDKLEEFIQEKVYDSYNGEWSLNGLRTNEFKESWDKTTPIIKGNLIESELFQNISNMKIIDEPPIHIDRDNLAKIIETGIGYNFGSTPPRPFWNSFINWAEINIYGIFKVECNNIGINT